MRLAEGFITHQTPETQVMVAVGKACEKFSGIARSNSTAAYIIDCLKNETTEEDIVQAVLSTYDVEPARARQDIARILAELDAIGALER